MREGILDQLPRTLQKGEIVFVAIPPTAPGVKNLKALISEFNRKGEWIRAEYGEQVTEASIPAKAAVILTLISTNHGALAHIRRVAERINACCPNQALTISETKDVLRTLYKVRQRDVDQSTPAAVEQNGNGNHGDINKTPQDLSVHQLNGQSSPLPAQEEADAQPETTDQVQEQTSKTPDQFPEVPSEVEIALAAIEKFRENCDETQLAILLLGDRLKAVNLELADRNQQLIGKINEITELRSQLRETEKMSGEIINLRGENRRLEGELQHSQRTFDSLEALIKGGRQK